MSPKSKKKKSQSENVRSIVLCVDVGNSHSVIGVWLGQEVVESWRLTTNQWSTSDELYMRLKALLESGPVSYDLITHVGLSSVIPAMERSWVKAINKLVDLPVQVVSAKNALGLEIHYDNPEALGADRIANVLALKEKGIQCGIAIDLGTATTFDVFKDGAFAGGLIVPGMRASLEYLTETASRLPQVSLEWTDTLLAQNTQDALRGGILYGFLGQMDYLLRNLMQELDTPEKDIVVIATGGWASLLGQKQTLIQEYNPFLTLEGIRLVALGGNDPKRV